MLNVTESLKRTVADKVPIIGVVMSPVFFACHANGFWRVSISNSKWKTYWMYDL